MLHFYGRLPFPWFIWLFLSMTFQISGRWSLRVRWKDSDFDVEKVSNNLSCIFFFFCAREVFYINFELRQSFSQPLICITMLSPKMMTGFSSFLSFLSSAWRFSHVLFLCCSVLLLLYLVLWLWSFILLSLFILLVVLSRVVLIFRCMLELSVSFIKTTPSKVLWLFTPKLCFSFSW